MESAYDRKFDEMKQYIPFLESMIKRLESTSSTSAVNPRQAQLDKIRSLRDLLLDKKKRMKMDNLLKCEQVLVNLYAKVEKKDTFPEVKPSTNIPKEKSDLESVRNKLKSVAKIKNDTPETLPEIARANDVESHYTGSKEPALFQRRPNMTKSPTRLVQDELSSPKKKSPLASQPRRSYTRVLVSPEPNSRQWSTPEKGSDSPLFSRRSPPKIQSPTSSKKEKKKTSKNLKLRKNKDLNITLNVPEESLHSLNTKDILSRIINCSDGDVDIDTLRELRSQILGELNHTGKTDDISDLILKSYKKKSKGKQSNSKKGRMKEIEEGELSDSESEAIENIYGSLVLVDKDKKSTQDAAIQDKDNQQRKIQICLVINKDEANAENKDDPHGVIDLSEFEMFSDSDVNKSKDIISIDSDTSMSSPVKAANVKTSDIGQVKKKNDMPSSVKTPNVKTTDIGQIKKKLHMSSPAKASNVKTTEVGQIKNKNAISSPVKNKNSGKVTETINIDDDDRSNETETTQSPKIVASKNSVKLTNEVQTTNVQTNKVEEDLKVINKQGGTSPIKTTNLNKSCIQENNSEEKQNAIPQEKVEELPKYTANFYKPIEEQQNKGNSSPVVDSDNISKNSTPQPTKVTSLDEPDVTSISKSTLVEESLSKEKDKRDEQIPLLNEPTVPPKAKADVLSEIDILQALKNEILSESIAVPGAEAATPALHQPKLTKVASVQEVMPKKRISIEKYKEISNKLNKPLFPKRKSLRKQENIKKQSLKLTDKECERFNLPKPLSLDDDDDVEDISDDDFLNDYSESMDLDDIYGDLAPKSPDNDFNEVSEESSDPVIIPTDPVKTIATNSRSDVDMRSLLPIMTPQQQAPLPVPPPIPASIISSLGFGAIVPPSPVYGLDKPSEPNIDLNNKTSDITRPSTVDPRVRRDLNSTASPNPYSSTIASNPKLMPLMSMNVSPNMNMNPSMTPSRMTNMAPMTPSYMPSIPLLMTPNARSFEMTPSHQSIDSDEPSTRQHVYAPSFSTCDSRDREPSVPKEPHWEMNKRIDPRSSRRSRFDESSTGGPQWESRGPRNVTGQPDRYDMNNRRNEDCPSTPIPSFGWMECPPTPGSSFGRQDPPMTPSHPFGRSDYPPTSKRPLLETPLTSTNSFNRLECPTTPSHPFGRGDCPPTPSHQFGRGDCPPTPSHPFGRGDCPPTPSHPFGRGDCPPTPSHPFGRGDCPPTPTHPFGRSDCPPTPSHQFGRSDVNQFGASESSNIPKFNKDPRLNRRQPDYESSSHYDRDRNHQNDRSYEYSSSSYKSQNRSYSHDTSRNYDKERSDERYGRSYNRERRQFDRDLREPSRGRSVSRDSEIDRSSRKRDSYYDDSHRNYHDVELRRNQREKSVGRTSEYRPRSERARSSSRATSACRFDRDRNNDFLSEIADTGKDFMINTSVKSTFLNFFDKGKPIQVFEDHKANSRGQRAASVGRSLVHDNNAIRKFDSVSKECDMFISNKSRNDKFKRACSMGRELANTKNEKSFQEVKEDLKTYESKFSAFKDSLKKPKPQSKTNKDSSHQDRKISLGSEQYSPRTNYRDPRMRRQHREEIKSKYKIDRRLDASNGQRSGIIYSNDNIAKGTIMGSGFGVKNYKIPKIKRPVVEPFVEVSTKDKEEKPETSHKIESKMDKNLKEIECDKKAKPKVTEKIIKPTDVKTSPQNELIVQRKDQSENIKDDDPVDDTERRVTRSKKKIEDEKSVDSVIRNRKSKKAVIYDSESDAENEKELSEKDTKNIAYMEKSSQKVNDAKKLSSPVKIKVAKNKSNEDILNSTFGINDMEMFTENIASETVIDNINALIADLDNDLDSSKISNDSFTTEMEKMMDTINSPEGNSLGDISEVIEKDLNESNEKLQHALNPDHNLLMESDKQKNIPSIPQEVNIDTNNANENSRQISSKSTQMLKDCFVKISVVEAQLNETINNKVAELAKDSEAIVSTSDIDTKTPDSDPDSKTSRDDIVNNEEKSIPDSTINKNTEKSDDGLPDSTNQMHCELSSDVTSTNESSEQSKKDSQNSNQNNDFGSIGNLLSILQDKTKIKELLLMLGDNQSGENEKLKKKLVKLSEFVSDDEDENDELEDKPIDLEKPKAADIDIERLLVKNTETTNIDMPTEEVSKESIQEDAQKVDKLQPPSIEENHESGIHKADKNTNNTIDKFSTENTDQSDIIPDEIDKGCVETPVGIDLGTASTDLIDETIAEDMEMSDMANKEDDEAQDSDTDDAPLIKEKKKLIKNVKGKKLKARPKVGTNKNKTAQINKLTAQLTRPNDESNKPKPKKKVNRELQKLQEDIKEMFMTDVLNATGIRMCRLAKMVSENDDMKKEKTSEPVVVLEKVKDLQPKDQAPKVRKKPGPKPKAKVEITLKDKKMEKPKSLPKYKPGPKCRTKQGPEIDPYDFESDSVTDTNTTRGSDDDSVDSDNESLASSRSFGSSEVLTEVKKKPRKKRRVIRRWQSGIIKPKNRKKKDQKLDNLGAETATVKSKKPITIPDLNCFIDKMYCFQKGITTYDCRLCVYSGTDIVNHYKKQHPHTEIPLSRMDPRTAELAIQQCEEINFKAISKIPSEKYVCRFCHKEFTNTRVALETFFWHVVSHHTGEFKHLCSECVNITHCPFNLDIPPPPKDGGQLIGYICGRCNFTQISLENLKAHVIVRHNDEHTEVYIINMAVMSNKAMKAMLRRTETQAPRLLRSSLSNQSATEASVSRYDGSDATESSDQNTDSESGQPAAEENEESESIPLKPERDDRMQKEVRSEPLDRMKSKITFEIEEHSDDTSIKIEQSEQLDDTVRFDYQDNAGHFDDQEESAHYDNREESPKFVDVPTNAEPTAATFVQKPARKYTSDIVDYPHFKIRYTNAGTKEYVCCINKNDNHYRTPLLISMKKHIQIKHTEQWDGYCCLCKVIVTLQGVQSKFRDCLTHFLDKHMDDFPVIDEKTREVIEEPESERTLPALTSIPARVATPPVRTASPSYIAVRPLAELMSKELVKDIEKPAEKDTALPKMENVVREISMPPAVSSPVYPTVEPEPVPEKPFSYEEVQAEVMSKKHRVVLDAMMLKENLVRVFKCAGRYCSFTSDSAEVALVHASTHQRVGGNGALNCAYCNYDSCDNGIDLVMHVFKEHSRCQFCCPLCFYRASASQLVGAHYAKAHSGITLKNILRSTAVVAPQQSLKTDLLSREVAVQHFVCNHEYGKCNFKTYTPGKFMEHIQMKHSTDASHPCNLCSSSFPSPSELVVHLRSHGLKLYQCTWCVHGANNEQELLSHAATKHPEKQPQAYIRIITNKDGGAQRVLPLAYLNKSKVPTEEVAPSTNKENPVREAERAIELEKLIHSMFLVEPSPTQTKEMQVEEIPEETAEPVEIPEENIEPIELPANTTNPPEVTDKRSTLEMLLATPHKEPPGNPLGTLQSNKQALLDTINKNLPIGEPTLTEKDTPSVDVNGTKVKAEPSEAIKEADSQIICLDSDEEELAPEEAPTNAIDNSAETIENVSTENVANEVGEVSRNSITDEVSLTKITDESAKAAEDASNIIDLSDDDLQTAASSASPAPLRLSTRDVYKCPNCEVTCKSENGFKRHVRRCTDLENMRCPHRPCAALLCGMPALLTHYSRVHMTSEAFSRMSYLCGVCRHPFSTAGGAKLHVRVVHKVTQYVVSATKEDGLELFVVSPAADTEPKRTSGRKTSTEILRYGADAPEPPRPRKAPPQEVKKKYGVDDVGKLPINPILDSQVYCELCEFGTKVRLNMVRHLQLHRQSAPVPRTEPVNPVPHLETNEKHFDKMVNLASSSLARERPAPPPAAPPAPAVAAAAPAEGAESSRYPPFVAERLRYVCGARGCAYLSVDVAMFKRHWETLHEGLTQYRCVHCPPNQALDTTVPLSAVRILAHLRMHDAALYACSACSYYHYRRHLIEKHISEKHAGAGSATVKVVREESGPPAAPPPPAAPAAPTMDLKPWQCGLCKFSSMLRPEVANHCGAQHQSKMQFKCGYCPFRTSAKENVVKHQTNSHPNRVEDVFYYFYREGSIPDEDGVPCWQRQRQKLNLDAEPEVKTEPEVESAPEPPSAPVAPPPPAVDLNIVKTEVAEVGADSDVPVEDLCKKYGQFCDPDGIKYKCCLCNTVREHLRDAMQCHMYEELNYRRWECAMCSYKAFHKNGLNDHMSSEHRRQYTPPRSLPVDHHVEKWVEEFLNHQTNIIEGNRKNLSEQKIQGERVSVPPPPKVIEPPKPTNFSDSELELAFGSFGAPKEHQFCCPKCEYTTKDESDMVCHLESELTKIRWGCTVCANKFQNFHEAQFHCKSAHSWPSARPKEAVRDPSLRAGWVSAVVATQRQFMKCVEVTPGSGSNVDEDSDANENSLLVARYDQPVNMDELVSVPHKRPAPADSDDERLVIDEPQKKKPNDRQCPYCDYTNATARCVREHIFRHYNMKPYKCSYCPYDGCRLSVLNHIEKQHPFHVKKVINVPVPSTPPPNMNPSKPPGTPKPKPSKEPDDGMKTVCLYCEKSVPISETESHTHGTEKPEFAKRGEVVIKCCKCLELRLTVMSIQEHFKACHPNETLLKYAYFKLQVDSREIQCCGHCYKKFKNLNNLKWHHSAAHAPLPFSYTSIPFSHNLHTEGDEIGSNKRKAEDSPGPSTKRVARKSTSKLPSSAVAKKSTTKLPYTDPESEEYSYYGTRPLSYEHYKDLTINIPMHNTVAEIDIERLSGMLKIDPRVVVKDYKS